MIELATPTSLRAMSSPDELISRKNSTVAMTTTAHIMANSGTFASQSMAEHSLILKRCSALETYRTWNSASTNAPVDKRSAAHRRVSCMRVRSKDGRDGTHKVHQWRCEDLCDFSRSARRLAGLARTVRTQGVGARSMDIPISTRAQNVSIVNSMPVQK